ncbi:hypothetical protein ES708_17724 [subsurface metagenome]
MPVQRLGVVESQSDAFFSARLGQFLERVTLKRGRLDNVVVSQFRIKQAETIMMFGSDDHPLHPCLPSQLDPLLCVKPDGIEFLGELFILLDGDFGTLLDPFAYSRNARAFPHSSR